MNQLQNQLQTELKSAKSNAEYRGAVARRLKTGTSSLDLRMQALRNAMRALDRSAGDVALETFANCCAWIAGFAGALADEARALETEIETLAGGERSVDLDDAE